MSQHCRLHLMHLIIKYVSNAWSIIIIITRLRSLLDHTPAASQSFVPMTLNIKAALRQSEEICLRSVKCSIYRIIDCNESIQQLESQRPAYISCLKTHVDDKSVTHEFIQTAVVIFNISIKFFVEGNFHWRI